MRPARRSQRPPAPFVPRMTLLARAGVSYYDINLDSSPPPHAAAFMRIYQAKIAAHDEVGSLAVTPSSPLSTKSHCTCTLTPKLEEILFCWRKRKTSHRVGKSGQELRWG